MESKALTDNQANVAIFPLARDRIRECELRRVYSWRRLMLLRRLRNHRCTSAHISTATISILEEITHSKIRCMLHEQFDNIISCKKGENSVFTCQKSSHLVSLTFRHRHDRTNFLEAPVDERHSAPFNYLVALLQTAFLRRTP
jgi:hypothetical protein